jgi:hypothetical protein
VGYSFWHYTNTDPVKTNRVKRGAWSTTCETVVNQCYNDGTCDNIAVYNGTAASVRNFFKNPKGDAFSQIWKT